MYSLENGWIYNFESKRFVKETLKVGNPAPEKKEIKIDVSGKYILPGFMDSHTHVGRKEGILPYVADEICPANGVTEVLDAGTYGVDDIETALLQDIPRSKVRIHALLHMAGEGQRDPRRLEDQRPKAIDEGRIREMFARYPSALKGLKVRLEETMIAEGYAADTLKKTVAIAEKIAPDCRIMLHIGDLPQETKLKTILSVLRPGDVITHLFQPKGKGLFDERGYPDKALCAAAKNGVLLDSGFGGRQWSFETVLCMLENGVEPDIISSDSNKGNIAAENPCSILYAMEILNACGMPLEKLLEKTIVLPKKIYRGVSEENLYAEGDITVISIEKKEGVIKDINGQCRKTSLKFQPEMTFVGGRICYDNIA